MRNKTVGIIGWYALLAFISVILYMTGRWVHHITPKVERTTSNIILDSDDPEMKKIAEREPVQDDMMYFIIVETTTTVEAGKFPFLKTTVIEIRNTHKKYSGKFPTE